jgi:c-di-GMP-binding flagellar brake protein YcgR
MRERRRDTRIAEENKVIMTVPGGRSGPDQGAVSFCFTRDISAGGLRIMTGARLQPGDIVGLEIALSGSRRTVRASGEVRWVREIYEKEVYEAGLAFVDLDPESEIALIGHVYGKRAGSRRKPGG